MIELYLVVAGASCGGFGAGWIQGIFDTKLEAEVCSQIVALGDEVNIEHWRKVDGRWLEVSDD